MNFKDFPLLLFLPEHSPPFNSEQKSLSHPHRSQQFSRYELTERSSVFLKTPVYRLVREFFRDFSVIGARELLPYYELNENKVKLKKYKKYR